MLLKTKDNERVREHGLNQNSASYELVNFMEDRSGGEKSYIMTIRSSTKNNWTGNMSFFDEKVGKFFNITKP